MSGTPDEPIAGLALRVARDGEVLASHIAALQERNRLMSMALASICSAMLGQEWDGSVLPEGVTPQHVTEIVCRKVKRFREFVAEFGEV